MAARTFLTCTKVLENPFGRRKIANPQTLGEHLLNRRLELGLLQREVAKTLSVSEDTITYWENGRANPQRRQFPRLFSFLGYYPFNHETDSVGGKLRQVRSCMGMTVSECAKTLQVSENAIRRWEAGRQICNPHYQSLIEKAWNELTYYFIKRPAP